MLAARPHICAFFNHPDEEYRTLLPFIKEGLESGEKAFHTVDPRRQKKHIQRLAAAGIDLDAKRRSGQFELHPWTEIHLRDGRFDPLKTLARFTKIVKSARRQGFPRIRFVTQMEWALEKRPGVDQLLEYEAKANQSWLGTKRTVRPIVCTYDLTKFGVETVVGVLRTHPAIIIGGILQENPFFVPPEEFLKELREKRSGQASTRLHDLLNGLKTGVGPVLAKLQKHYSLLTPREREVLSHVVAGKLNKQTAASLMTQPITVQVHRGRIMRKMAAQSFADLIRMAGKLGIRRPPRSRRRRYIKT